jgi:hypothetical protein
MGIALSDVCVNGGNQLGDTAKYSATNLFGCQVAKDAFHQIEPGTTGRREVHLDAWVARQPPLHRGMFVRGIVVRDQMQGPTLGNLTINQTQEPQPFLVPMPWQARREDRALGNIQSGKERGRTMALLVVRHRAAPALLDG